MVVVVVVVVCRLYGSCDTASASNTCVLLIGSYRLRRLRHGSHVAHVLLLIVIEHRFEQQK